MSFDKKRPNFFDNRTSTNSRPLVARNVQTKLFDLGDSVDTAKPDETVTSSDVRPWRVSFHIESRKVEMIFEVNGRMNIGRSSQEDEFFDGIDLSPFSGFELGVSRVHAELSLKNERITITDKGSANGTLLNQQRLEPDTPYWLRHGDNVQFGNMLVHIHFLTPIFETN